MKLADFGVSKQILTEAALATTKGIVGSPYWLSPEALAEKEKDGSAPSASSVGPKADVWALGITAFELANGYPPFFEEPPFQVMLRILRSDPPSLTDPSRSKELRDFVSACLVKDPVKRPTAASLLNHEFISRFTSMSRASVMDSLLSMIMPTEDRKDDIDSERSGTEWEEKIVSDTLDLEVGSTLELDDDEDEM